LAQDLLGWINLKPPSDLAANLGNAAVWDGLIAFLRIRGITFGQKFSHLTKYLKRISEVSRLHNFE